MKNTVFKTIGTAVANNCGAMEADTISKNGRSSKSQMSRSNKIILREGKMAKRAAFVMMLFLLKMNIYAFDGFISTGIGARTSSVNKLNAVLREVGREELNPIALNISIGGGVIWNNGLLLKTNLNWDHVCDGAAICTTKSNSFGLAFEFGYAVLNNDKTMLFPYLGLIPTFSNFRTQQKTDAKTFNAAYNQPAAIHYFYNPISLDVTFGLAYRIKIYDPFFLEIGGGYNHSLLQSKWRYAGNKIDFPKFDTSGWIFSLTFVGQF